MGGLRLGFLDRPDEAERRPAGAVVVGSVDGVCERVGV